MILFIASVEMDNIGSYRESMKQSPVPHENGYIDLNLEEGNRMRLGSTRFQKVEKNIVLIEV